MIKLPLKIALLIIGIVSAGVLWQKSTLIVLGLTQIDPIPETRALVEEKKYAEASQYLGFFMDYEYVRENPEAQALHAQIQSVRGSADYQLEKLKEGLLNGTSDDTTGQIAGVLTDFMVIGDVRDLVKEGVKLSNDEEVDEVLVALSTIGLAATAAQVASAGAATPIKGSVVALKVARKIGKLPSWLGKTILAAADTVKKTKKIDGIKDLFTDVYRVVKVPNGLELLSHTKDAASLHRMAQLAEALGKQAATLYKIGGDALVKIGPRISEFGADTVKLAGTFGKKGLHALDKVGATTFVKYSARSMKVAYKGDFIQLLSRLLSILPDWLLMILTASGIFVWTPQPVLAKIMAPLQFGRNPFKVFVPPGN